MKAAQLHGPGKIRMDTVPEPAAPGKGEVLLDISSVGICGSDLHMFETGTIAGIKIDKPLILGHEFSARIRQCGEEALDDTGEPLQVGQRVAVEPSVPCGKCEQCVEGNPNLCPHHYFYGVYPTNGALCEQMVVQSRNCFPLPDSVSDAGGALLETLGVALHSLDLGKLRVGDTVAVIGCGPVGALITRLAVLAGAGKVLAFDKLPWRVELASRWGADAHLADAHSSPELVKELTNGRGVDVAFEAAWADHSVQQAIDMARYGGRVVMVGIPPDNQFRMTHSVARRKGLTIRMVHRMKHTYPRAIALASGPHPRVPLDDMVTHTFSLDEIATAYRENVAYREDLIKGIIRIATGD